MSKINIRKTRLFSSLGLFKEIFQFYGNAMKISLTASALCKSSRKLLYEFIRKFSEIFETPDPILVFSVASHAFKPRNFSVLLPYTLTIKTEADY
jgi:hypothetical protein